MGSTKRIATLLFLVASAASAQRGMYRPGTGNPDIQLVPWKFLGKSDDLVKGPMVVYWLPSTTKDIEHSPLFTSPVLLEASVRCIQFEIVSPEDARLGVKPPAALVTGIDGKVLRQVSASRPKAVEEMVTAELNAREDAVLADLAKARREKSVDLYKKIWDDRCMYPLIGVEAQRGLKELGVIVLEPPSTLMEDPNLKVNKPAPPPKKKPD